MDPIVLETETLSASLYHQRTESTATAVNDALTSYLNQAETHAMKDGDPPEVKTLWQAARYAVLNGGKRIRPLLLIHSCLTCGGTEAMAMPVACAMELVHAQSLIHDDLPCMDDDDLRRGKPTVHKAFGESTAVLVGDALLAMSFGLMAQAAQVEGVCPKDVLALIEDFSKVSSMHGLVNGQYADIVYEDKESTPEAVEYIHRYKTAAMFRFAMRAGAQLAGASDKTVSAFTVAGEQLGLAFQIVDDILDIEANSDTLGKTVGKDQAQNKTTYPAVFGIEASRHKAIELVEQSLAKLALLPDVEPEQFKTVQSIGQYMIERVY